MPVKHLIGRRGIGFSPGSVKYIVTLGLATTDASSGTGQTGSASLVGYSQQAGTIVTYSRQSGTVAMSSRQSASVESP